MAWAQLFAGTSINILEDVFTLLDYVPAHWIMALHKFLNDIKAIIKIYKLLVYPIQQEHDHHIMDIVHQLG